ncbi:MAG: response regulator transcription factor [Neptuniibacter sp.]
MRIAIVSNFPVVRKYLVDNLLNCSEELQVSSHSEANYLNGVKNKHQYEYVVLDGNGENLFCLINHSFYKTKFIILGSKKYPSSLVHHIGKVEGFIHYETSSTLVGYKINRILSGLDKWSSTKGFDFLLRGMRNRRIVASHPLTNSEGKVGKYLAQGLMNKQIAFELGIKESTVKAHVRAIKKKCGLDTRTKIAVWLSESM